MKSIPGFLSAVVVVVALAASGCSSAPAPAPTQAPTKVAEPTKAAAPAAAPTKAAEPTKPAAPAATTAPAAKINYPEKGKTITVIVPFAAGGPVDILARALAPALEKELGTQIVIVDKAGASTIVGLTEVAKAKPDGHTLGFVTSSTPPAIADPATKTDISFKSFETIANVESHSTIYLVAANSPYKSLKELVEAAKAKPKSVRFASSAQTSPGTMLLYDLQDLAGVEFAIVPYDSGAETMAAVLGGHADFSALNPNLAVAQVKAGAMRALATTGKKPNKYLPDVPTVMAQGYDTYVYNSIGLLAPAGTPKEIVSYLSGVVKKTLTDPAVEKMMLEQYNEVDYMEPAAHRADLERQEAAARKLFERLKKQQ